MDTIAFKLEDKWSQALISQAPQVKNLSRHMFAKHIVIEFLKDSEREEIKDELVKLRREVNRLRQDNARAVAALLIKAGKIHSSDEAKAWVEQNFFDTGDF